LRACEGGQGVRGAASVAASRLGTELRCPILEKHDHVFRPKIGLARDACPCLSPPQHCSSRIGSGADGRGAWPCRCPHHPPGDEGEAGRHDHGHRRPSTLAARPANWHQTFPCNGRGQPSSDSRHAEPQGIKARSCHRDQTEHLATHGEATGPDVLARTRMAQRPSCLPPRRQRCGSSAWTIMPIQTPISRGADGPILGGVRRTLFGVLDGDVRMGKGSICRWGSGLLTIA